MINKLLRPLLSLVAVIGAGVLTNCASPTYDYNSKMIVSVRDQKLLLVQSGKPVKTYKISTSKFGVGDSPGTNRTPLGKMTIAGKIGEGQKPGTVFKSRKATGEVVKPNAPGRDPIVSRILWLRGTQSENRNAFRRYIYIHGTPEMSRLGTPASYGCIRMGMKDVIDLYNRVGVGAEVHVVRGSLGQPVTQKNMVAR